MAFYCPVVGQHRGEERVLIIYEYFFGEQEKPTPPFHVNMEKCAPCVLQGGSKSEESYAPNLKGSMLSPLILDISNTT